jgi:membrane-associated phospholipid phosphatase
MRAPALALVLSFACLIVDPHVAIADDVSVQEHIKRFARDGAYLAAAPLRLRLGDLLPLAIVGGAIGATIAYDGELHGRMAGLRHWGGANDLATTGDVLQYGGLIGGAGLYAYGRATHDDRAIDQAWAQADGALWALVATEGLKYTIGRERPNKGHPHAFHPFGRDTSFPSGHTVPAFTAATIAVEEYPSVTTAVSLFGLATAVGVSRIAADEHWTGDVVASAALGVVIGHVLYHVHARPSDNWSMDVCDGMVQLTRRW